MDLSQLENIIAIAEEKNIARAAERKFLTQSALNQQLLRLDEADRDDAQRQQERKRAPFRSFHVSSSFVLSGASRSGRRDAMSFTSPRC